MPDILRAHFIAILSHDVAWPDGLRTRHMPPRRPPDRREGQYSNILLPFTAVEQTESWASNRLWADPWPNMEPRGGSGNVNKGILRWLSGGYLGRQRVPPTGAAALPFRTIEDAPKRAGAHTQLNLLTKSYESRSVTVRGGCVCTRCVMYVRVWGLVHKVAPTQARLMCKTHR